jgi:membrane protease YdiL (CAAX protease family)
MESAREMSNGQKAVLALLCIVCGYLPVAGGYVPGDIPRLAYGLVVTGAFLTVALLARNNPSFRRYWEIALAFFGLALFILLDRYVPHLLEANVLHDNPISGNPYASTVAGTVVIQLDELVLTAVAIFVVLRISGASLSSIYLHRGRFGRAYLIGIVGFVALYVLTFRVLSHTHFMPFKGDLSLSRYLSLTPALLVMVASNGFLEELTFRGLLMSRLNLVFGPFMSTLVQAVIFASWHLGVTYTPYLLVFVVFVIFPIGLIAGYLTRSAHSILAPSILHAGVDLPVYLGFLSYVS